MTQPTQMQRADDFDDFLMPTPDDVQAQMQQASKSKSDRRSPANYLRVPPPEGAKDWRGARVGASNSVSFWLAPMYAPGHFGFAERSHFIKTSRAPNGTSMLCTGSKCLLCAAYFALRDQQDQDTKAKVEFCRRRHATLFNVINLSDPKAQVYDDGTVRPLIASFSNNVAKMLYDILEDHGPGICHPQTGRGLKWKKKKDGERMTEVSSFLTVLDKEPLPRDLWHLCKPQNLWHLHEISESLLPTPQEQAEALSDMGLPVLTGPGLPEVAHVAAFAHPPAPPRVAAAPRQALPPAEDNYTEGRQRYARQEQAHRALTEGHSPAPAHAALPQDDGPLGDEPPPLDDADMPADMDQPQAHDMDPSVQAHPARTKPAPRDERPWERYRAGSPAR